MNTSSMRVTFAGVVFLGFSLVGGASAWAQALALTATGTAGAPSPNPAPVGQTVQVSLSASANNTPVVTYPCTLQGPTWGWSMLDPAAPLVPVIQYSATANGPWGASPGGCFAYISQPISDATQPNDSSSATLSVYSTQPGYWRISPVITVSYTDTCANIWTASSQLTVADILFVRVTFDPSSVTIDTPGDTASVTATVTPADAASQVTFDTYDHTVATVTASSSLSPVPLTVMAVGEGGTQLVGWLGGYFVASAPVTVAATAKPQRVPLGPNGLAVTKPGSFYVHVPTSAGGVLYISADAGPAATKA